MLSGNIYNIIVVIGTLRNMPSYWILMQKYAQCNLKCLELIKFRLRM